MNSHIMARVLTENKMGSLSQSRLTSFMSSPKIILLLHAGLVVLAVKEPIII